jgi:hypothetical protein
VNRLGYQVLGFVVWKGAKWYLRRRYGEAPRKIAAVTAVALLLLALLLGGRRVASES